MPAHNVVFLPGIIAPAAQRYEALLHHLVDVNPLVQDLEVYRGDAPPYDYSIATEVDGVLRAVDEPAGDFTDQGNAEYGWPEFDRLLRQPPGVSMAGFLKLQVAPGVALPPPPAGTPPAWMAKRPAGMRAFIAAVRAYHLTEDEYRAFTRPVYFTRGSLTHQRWRSMGIPTARRRLA